MNAQVYPISSPASSSGSAEGEDFFTDGELEPPKPNLHSPSRRISNAATPLRVIRRASMEALNVGKALHKHQMRHTIVAKEAQKAHEQHEKENAKNARFTLHPLSPVRFKWDLVIAMCTIFLALEIPLVLGFQWEVAAWIYYIEVLMDPMYILDIIINFRTGYFEDVEAEMRPQKIAKHYLKFWFWVDALGAFPFELFALSLGYHRKTWKAVIKYVKLPKLLRSARLGKFLFTYYKYMYVMQIWIVFLTLCHWSACVLGAIMDDKREIEPVSIPGNVTNVAFFEALQRENCGTFSVFSEDGVAMTCQSLLSTLQDFQNKILTQIDEPYLETMGIWDRYAESLRNALLILTLSGGDVDLPEEYHWWGSIFTLLGSMIMSLVFGSATTVIFMNVASSASYQEKVKRIMSELKSLEVPLSLRKRTKHYYDLLWRLKKSSWQDERLVYDDNDLAMNLRQEIALHVHRDLISTVPLFEDCSDHCLASIVMKLKTQLYLTGDFLITKGDPGTAMMLLFKGTVHVLHKDNKQVIAVLQAGSFFGEMALLERTRRSSSVIAASFCEVKILMASDCEELFSDYPFLLEKLRQTAEQRFRMNSQIKDQAEAPKAGPRKFMRASVLNNFNHINADNYHIPETSGSQGQSSNRSVDVEDDMEHMPKKLSLHPKIANAETLNHLEGKVASLEREIGELKGTLKDMPSQLTQSILNALKNGETSRSE